MFNGNKISVIMPAYNEEASIKAVVKDFSKSFVDEVVVADNNSTDSTAKLAVGKGVKLVNEKYQGFGAAIKLALQNATGDFIFIVESDGTFSADDMEMFLKHMDNHDIVFGSRLTQENIRNGSVKWYVFLGNFFISFIMRAKYHSRFDDLGCTYKLISRKALVKIVDFLSVKDAGANVEYVLLSLKNGLSYKQIPITYRKRIGQSKLSPNFFRSFLIGLKRLWLVAIY